MTNQDAVPARKDLTAIVGAFAAFFLTGCGAIIWFTGTQSATGIIAALASIGVGSVFGFLFGIPKTLTDSSRPSSSEEERQARFQDNTNLEQISDWLTKILIGAGLVQIRELSAGVQRLAATVAKSFPASVASQAEGFVLLCLTYFTIVGFLTGYIITRLYLPGALIRARDEGLKQTVERVESDVDKLLTIFEADPNKNQFGGAAEVNGRKLDAVVAPVDEQGELYIVKLMVSSTDPSKPLKKPVIFYLHPTFDPSVRTVSPVDGRAELTLRAWGAFTVGAETDDGQTRLELDLSELLGAPEKFKSR